MLNIKNITFAYFAALWVLFNFSSLHYSFYIIATVFYFIIPVTASLSICSNLYLKVICKWKTEKENIILSFNLVSGKKKVYKVIAILKKHNIKTIVFCSGQMLESSPELVDKLKKSGNTIGNFSFSVSKKFGFLSPKKLINELSKTEDMIYSSNDEDEKYFRPPFGITNPSVKKATEIMNYRVIGWNNWIRLDNSASGQKIEKIISGIKRGSIIRIDISDDLNLTALDEFISKLLKNFSVIDINEMII